MSLRDFGLLVLICLVWASNNIISKIVVAHWGVPPLFYAAVRFSLVALATLPWLLPAPRPTWRIVVVALLMGAGNFALLFMGFKTASPSAASVVIQLGVPFTTLLSMVMLGETIRWRRGRGIALTLAGAVTVMWSPHGFVLSPGLWLIVAAAFAGSLGAVALLTVPFLLATVFLGFTLRACFSRRETAMQVLLFTSILFVFLGGFAWPVEGVPVWIRQASQAVPTTAGIPAYLRLTRFGAGLADVSREAATLWGLAAVYFATACVVESLGQRRARRLRRDARGEIRDEALSGA